MSGVRSDCRSRAPSQGFARAAQQSEHFEIEPNSDREWFDPIIDTALGQRTSGDFQRHLLAGRTRDRPSIGSASPPRERPRGVEPADLLGDLVAGRYLRARRDDWLVTADDQVRWVELQAGEALTVYRLVSTDDRDHAELLNCFRSNAERGKPPRGREKRQPAVHGGLSVFKSKAQAVDRQRRIAARLAPGETPRIGSYVATVAFKGPGVRYEDRDQVDGHMTIWAPAERCVASLVDISSVDQ